MRTQPPAVRRLCFATDVEGYRGRDNLGQLEIQARLLMMTNWALRQARLRKREVDLQPHGDGHVVVLPAGIDEFQAIPAILLGLRDALATANQQMTIRMRMRLAMAEGVVQPGDTGFVSRAVVNAATILDSTVLRDWLVASRTSNLVVALTEDLFKDVIEPRPAPFDARTFQPVSIPSKGGEWLAARLHETREPDASRFDAEGGYADLGTLLGTLTLGLGALAAWELWDPDDDNHPQDHPGPVPDDPDPEHVDLTAYPEQDGDDDGDDEPAPPMDDGADDDGDAHDEALDGTHSWEHR